VVLTFDPGDQQPGLVLQAGADTSFEVAGSDGKFEPATVEVRATTLAIRTAKVREPRAVRYAWHGNPTATLFNRAGLPAAPFRMNAKNASPDDK
jgi:sialate O-acetylesterase